MCNNAKFKVNRTSRLDLTACWQYWKWGACVERVAERARAAGYPKVRVYLATDFAELRRLAQIELGELIAPPPRGSTRRDFFNPPLQRPRSVVPTRFGGSSRNRTVDPKSDQMKRDRGAQTFAMQELVTLAFSDAFIFWKGRGTEASSFSGTAAAWAHGRVPDQLLEELPNASDVVRPWRPFLGVFTVSPPL